MIKYHQIGGFVAESNFPNAKAAVEMPRYCFAVIDQAALTVKFAASTDSDENYGVVSQDLLNPVGDSYFWKDPIKVGEYVHFETLATQVGRKIEIDAEHISTDYASIAKENVLIPDGTGKVAVGAAPEAGIYLIVKELIRLTGPAVRALVVRV